MGRSDGLVIGVLRDVYIKYAIKDVMSVYSAQVYACQVKQCTRCTETDT